ncbi:primosomal protein N' [Cellulomonas fimi]|uniref:Probable replication restart protein PriA n=2 Tax=Cellulomonas fimi TaxID=1708 RepID=F4GZQ6_CELFA|nr:primosomal protein N' [Cellulomonas fimi]AEE46100.1 primosomal protein N' (replication factor Y) - superfamily II helicase-like protein [Cellulomonas fimi ATCC 484]VEH31630.1 Primosomal protein N' [Cellulomonas fimi]
MTSGEQLVLDGVPGPRRRARPRLGAAALEPAEHLPVARVLVDVSPAHLDRPFEYLVPARADDAAAPGVRVKVRFGGQDVDGYLLERAEQAEHVGQLAPLRRVVSPEPVLTPDVLTLARAVADRWAGTLSDVLRLAVPARHARTEAERFAGRGDGEAVGPPAAGAPAWAPYRGGPAFVQHVLAGGAPRAVWTALPGAPGERWDDAVAQAVAACVLGGRGALVVVPDARDVARVLDALARAGVPAWSPERAGGAVRLAADDGPAARYRAFLAALRGSADVVVGTRASAFAPVHDLGLVVCWDDGDALHAEPRAPYPHVREVLALRSDLAGCALLVGGHGRTVEAQALVESGWAKEVAADRATTRARTPRVRALTSVELAREGPAAAARLPSPAWRTLRDRLADGPVLVQVPRAGYVPVVACGRCRADARCGTCHGPLGITGQDGVPTCGWCGRLATGWRCGECGGTALRSVRVGSERTAEELGRAFPGVPVRVSGARASGGVLASVPDVPAVVVATPGAEPVAPSGYAAALLLDAAVGASGAGLGATVGVLRRWLTAAALVRPADDGGQVLLVGDAPERPTQALVRWDPAGLAARESAERAELGLPPAVRVAAVTGPRDAVEALLARVDVEGAEVLGPVPVPTAPAPGELAVLEPDVRALVRVPRARGAALARAVAASLAVRSARREGGSLRVQVDPADLT